MVSFQERRRKLRTPWYQRVELRLRESNAMVNASSLDVGEGGMRLRLSGDVSVNSRLTLRLFSGAADKPLECSGRVAWVVQRLDLRQLPPYIYDIGIEWVNPPEALRRVAAGAGSGAAIPKGHSHRIQHFGPVVIRERTYVAQLERESSLGEGWHLVVRADGAPCLSRRFGLEREAIDGWERFVRQRKRATSEAKVKA